MTGPGDGPAARLAALTGTAVTEIRPLGGQHGARHYRAVLADGRAAFVKTAPSAGHAALASEARGLRWLAEAHAAAIPEIIATDATLLAVSWVGTGPVTSVMAERFGRDLAALHQAGAPAFGAPWEGFLAGLPLSNAGGGAWPDWYAEHRVLPYLRRAVDAGVLAGADARVIVAALGRAAAIAGPPEPPSRLHGDCWSGNVLWSDGRGWLIDPAAHGGHRETDLAMLALFGAPGLAGILAGYQEVSPLADGWRDRVPLHQLHPLLVHVCLFGASYTGPALTAARSVLAL